jgi:hypothetical protein
MFIDYSPRKMSLLALATLSLAASITYSLAALAQNQGRIEAAGYALGRIRSELGYAFFYKIPLEGRHALASAGSAPLTTSGAVAATSTAESIPVLLYHGENGGPSMSTATFVEQLYALKRAGWKTITLAQFEAFMQGKGTVPDKSFLLTFDDGRRDTFYTVDPVLRDLHYTAVMFVITGLSLPGNADHAENDFYLSKQELAFMAGSGRWELESHGDFDHSGYPVPTATSTAASLDLLPSEHFLSNLFWVQSEARLETPAEYETRITADLAHAKALLETDFGAPVTAYAYPFNDFGEDTVNYPEAEAHIATAVDANYRYSFYQTWAGNGDSFNYPDPSATLIKRIEPAASWSGSDLIAVLDGGRAKSLPYTALFFGSDWQTNWGAVTPGAALSLAATPSTTGAAAFLDGTETWTNYVIRAQADIAMGTLSLIARHTETDAAYFACAFSDDHIYLERHSGEAQVTLAEQKYAPSAGERAVSMTVDGTRASCSADGVTVSGTSSLVATHGGVGLSVWDPENGTARLSLTHFAVSPL